MTPRITVGIDLPLHARELLAVRQKRGWTQQQLAKALGVSETTVYNWERGRSEPHPHRMAHIRRLLTDPEQMGDTVGAVLTALASLELDETCGNISHPDRVRLASALYGAFGRVMADMLTAEGEDKAA